VKPLLSILPGKDFTTFAIWQVDFRNLGRHPSGKLKADSNKHIHHWGTHLLTLETRGTSGIPKPRHDFQLPNNDILGIIQFSIVNL